MFNRLFSISVLFLVTAHSTALAEVILKSGRQVDPKKSFLVSGRLGTMSELSGRVEETSRLVTRRTGRSAGDLPEAYDLEELGFDHGSEVFGLTVEKQWKYFTLGMRGNYSRAEATERAVRDFYLGVEKVTYNGQSYQYIKIPEGDPYHAELNNLFMHLTLKWTPITFYATEKVAEFTPWLGVGLYGVAGEYSVVSGKSRGIVLSEFPAREYVVGGRGKATNGGAVPEIGLGGELSIGLTNDLSLDFEGHAGYVKYNGSTAALGIESRNVKDLDMEYLSIELAARLVLEVSDETDFFVGVSWEHVDTEAYAKAFEGQSDAEILAKREKFDKDIELQYSFITAEFGWMF